MSAPRPAAREFPAAPLGGLERFLTVVSFSVAGVVAAGGWWVKENANELGGLAGLVVAALLAVLVITNRLRVPDRYVLTSEVLCARRGARELAQVSVAAAYAAERLHGPYLPHRYSLDPRALFADAFGWNGAYFSPAVGQHRLLGTNLHCAVVVRGEETWVFTPAEPEAFVRAVQPRLRGKPPAQDAEPHRPRSPW